jgi:hypothetical protein
MKLIFFLIILCFSICSCLYKAGNRQPDINLTWRSSISPYYIKAYMKNLDSFSTNRGTVTSEIVNFPENFIPVTDSSLGLKFVIEFHSLDSLSYRESNYFAWQAFTIFKKQSGLQPEIVCKTENWIAFEGFSKVQYYQK